MAKATREFELRMQGMIAAQRIVSDGGLEALTKDIKYRGLTKAPITVSQADIDSFVHEVSENLHMTVMIVAMTALHEEFGFGEKRLKQFKTRFDRETQAACDMNWVGNHYVTLTDYADSLIENFHIDGLDKSILATCEQSFDSTDQNYKKVKLDRLIEELTKHGFGDAATWLLEYWKDY